MTFPLTTSCEARNEIVHTPATFAVRSGTRKWGGSVTVAEVRNLREHWDKFKGHVVFYDFNEGGVVNKPW